MVLFWYFPNKPRASVHVMALTATLDLLVVSDASARSVRKSAIQCLQGRFFGTGKKKLL